MKDFTVMVDFGEWLLENRWNSRQIDQSGNTLYYQQYSAPDNRVFKTMDDLVRLFLKEMQIE